eukprot:6207470-Pyramimonas_sp.AAC.1
MPDRPDAPSALALDDRAPSRQEELLSDLPGADRRRSGSSARAESSIVWPANAPTASLGEEASSVSSVPSALRPGLLVSPSVPTQVRESRIWCVTRRDNNSLRIR